MSVCGQSTYSCTYYCIYSIVCVLRKSYEKNLKIYIIYTFTNDIFCWDKTWLECVVRKSNSMIPVDFKVLYRLLSAFARDDWSKYVAHMQSYITYFVCKYSMRKIKNALSKMQWHIFFHEVINYNGSIICTVQVLTTNSKIHDPYRFIFIFSIFAYLHNVSEIGSFWVF